MGSRWTQYAYVRLFHVLLRSCTSTRVKISALHYAGSTSRCLSIDVANLGSTLLLGWESATLIRRKTTVVQLMKGLDWTV